ncbi:MAG: ATP-binding cassette domain-containing protein [Propionibacteriaceae bacterium]|jgi:ABC-type branched-subunit amino acid transport system ATPase component|nr:ATP-binding cassette domain-containing protein [Propionibacteriaceae bacterium]
MTMNQYEVSALTVTQLSKSFGSLKAVDDVSFVIQPGEVVSIIGPNGSGKTTLINLISGLLQPDSGAIVFAGQDLTRANQVGVCEAGIGRTFQNGRVFASMTVDDNVELGLHSKLTANRPGKRFSRFPVGNWVNLLAEAAVSLIPSPQAKKELAKAQGKIDEQIARFKTRLEPRRNHLAYTLSYANRRRTEIARALVAQPKLLLLDEPTAGMNQAETKEVLRQLLELKQEGQSMLLVEHKIDLVLTLSDRVIVMDSGKKIAEGKPDSLHENPVVMEAYLGTRREAITVRPPRPASDEPLLELDNVNIFYGLVQALTDVSLTVGKGEIVSLLGGNASGKSTTMKTILGLLEPKTGTVTFQGNNLTTASTAARVRAGMASVPEARRIFPEMTVYENLMSGAYTRMDRQGIREDLDRVFEYFPRLWERKNQDAGTLSGGEQQMLAFGRALMTNPVLICMDEPTMGLAPKLVEQVLEQIAHLRNELGVSVLMVEQQAELALSIADRGYVLNQGEITLQGSAQTLLDDPGLKEAYFGRQPEYNI